MCRLLGSVSLGFIAVGMMSTAAAQQNVLLIVADDLGVDRVAAYGEHPDPGRTPVLDSMAQDGILFRNVWSNPVCSTSRATILTGRYGFRTGIGRGIGPSNAVELDVDEVTIADVVSPLYSTAAVGKWHLHTAGGADPLGHPMLMGFSNYLGGMNVLPGPIFTSDAYVDFSKNVNGVVHQETLYATTDEVNDTLGFVNNLSEPWFVQLAFHAPHAPFHKPPASLHTYSLPPNVLDDVPLHTKAMIEAMDTEIGRLLALMKPAVRANTVIIFVGDNGTDSLATTPPHSPDHAKTTIFEGGINVPLIVTGPGVVSGAECTALVNLTDIFATVADIAGVSDNTGVDSVSLLPYFTDPFQPSQRSWVYAEMFSQNGYLPYERNDRTVRDDRYKLLCFHEPFSTGYMERFFDLDQDPFELDDLLVTGPLSVAQQASYDTLSLLLPTLRETWVDMGGAVAGMNGLPRLTGSGELLGDDPVHVTLTDARANALFAYLIGPDMAPLPVLGGVITPDYSAGGIVGLWITDSTGAVSIDTTWPPGVPAGFLAYMQIWIVDHAGTNELAASNVLRVTTG